MLYDGLRLMVSNLIRAWIGHDERVLRGLNLCILINDVQRMGRGSKENDMQVYDFEPACWSVKADGLDDLDECPVGLLSFDGMNAPELNIIRGHLVSEHIPEDGGLGFDFHFHKEAVFGLSRDRKYYVLRDVQGRNAVPTSLAFDGQAIYGQSIIVANRKIDVNPAISELTVDLSGFREWIGKRFYKPDQDGGRKLKFSYPIETPENILLYKNEDLEIHANHFAKQDGGYDAFFEFSFKETWRLNFKILSSEGMPLDSVLEKYFEPFERLLTFCMGFPGNIEEITFTGVDPAVSGRYFDRYVPGEKDRVNKLADNMPMPYSDLIGRFQDIADKWMSATGYARKACETATALLGERGKLTDVMFLTCAHGFEAISRVGENPKELADEEFKRRKDYVLENIKEDKIRRWANNKLEHANSVAAGELASRLLAKLDGFADYVVPDGKLFLRQHRESRNAYTHLRESDSSDFMEGSDLYWHARATQVLQYGAVMLYLGFQPSEVLSVFEEKNFLEGYIRVSREMYSKKQH